MNTKDYYNEILDGFKKQKDGVDLWKKYEDLLKPYFEEWAEAKNLIVNGNPAQKSIGNQIVKMITYSIDDINKAIKLKEGDSTFSNSAKKLLGNIVTDFLLPFAVETIKSTIKNKL